MNVALLGTGLLGQGVAVRLHATGHPLTAYNRSIEKTHLLQQHVAENSARQDDQKRNNGSANLSLRLLERFHRLLLGGHHSRTL